MIKITDNRRGYIFVYHTPICIRIWNFYLLQWLIYREFSNDGSYHLPCITKRNIITLFNLII